MPQTPDSQASEEQWMAEAEKLARFFHETYERLAPQFGYETRKETRVFDPESVNGKLMIAVCDAVLRSRPAATCRAEQRGPDEWVCDCTGPQSGCKPNIGALARSRPGVAPEAQASRLTEAEIHARDWWCPHCKVDVPPEMVTKDGEHYLESGGCGRAVRGELWDVSGAQDDQRAALSPSPAAPNESPVAQRSEQNQQSAHEAGDAEAAPQERQVSNLRQSEASSTSAACVLASAPGAPSPAAEGAGTTRVLNALEVLGRAALGTESQGTAAHFLKCLGEGGMLVIENPLHEDKWAMLARAGQLSPEVADAARETAASVRASVAAPAAAQQTDAEWPESVMRQWDYWRARIASGDTSSAPRDWFESLVPVAAPAQAEVPSEHVTVDAVAWEAFINDYGRYVDGDQAMPFAQLRESLAAVIDSAALAAAPSQPPAVDSDTRDAQRLAFMFAHCRIVFFPPDGAYPVEHNPFALGYDKSGAFILGVIDAARAATKDD